MKRGTAVDAAHAHFQSFLRSRSKAKQLDLWVRGRQLEVEQGDEDRPITGEPFTPRERDQEYDDIASRAPSAFAGLVVTSLAQTAYVDGMMMPGKNEPMRAYDDWQRNRWDSKQIAVNRCAIGLGQAYGIVLPGKDPLTGDAMSKWMARSPKAMAAFYDNDDDEWCTFAIEAQPVYEKVANGLIYTSPVHTGWTVALFDEQVVHRLSCKGDGVEIKDWTYIAPEDHGMPVPPVARGANRLDLDGRATGEIEPIIPLLRRIDQDVFDRLIVQRFGAWMVRYIAGLAKPEGSAQVQAAYAMKLRIEDFLVSPDPETKFGTLNPTPLKPFEEVTDADLRMLAAITQTPPHHLLGLSSNLQAESLAAAESGLQRKSQDYKTSMSEFYEQMARLSAMVRGDKEEANAYNMQVRWRDTESRSLVQAADALGKLAVQLKIPVEMLWEKVPGWTDNDTARAKSLVEEGGIEALLQELMQDDPNAQGGGSGDGAADSGN
jgi:hypothetical protein